MEVEVDGGNEYPAHYKVMMDKLNEQRQLDQFTDITLIVDGKSAHIVGHLYDVPKQCFLFPCLFVFCRTPVQSP